MDSWGPGQSVGISKNPYESRASEVRDPHSEGRGRSDLWALAALVALVLSWISFLIASRPSGRGDAEVAFVVSLLAALIGEAAGMLWLISPNRARSLSGTVRVVLLMLAGAVPLLYWVL